MGTRIGSSGFLVAPNYEGKDTPLQSQDTVACNQCEGGKDLLTLTAVL